ncbi:MAG: Kae1-associated serine/threonine protein kinase [Candidatus Pacearchaeota archaeon]|nr:Kae1-associated serine/threonine protein kinase [Candidatus Pacearchaeota archaeon]
MNKKILSRGAEAVIYLEDDKVIKERLKKGYRLPELDKKIIKRRTKAETKILKKASEVINAPKPEETEKENAILIPFIEGDKLSDELNSYEEKKQEETMKKVGIEVGKLHREGIIHGDLTTSNMILKNGEIYIVDFGLGSFNGKYEQKGVDIHLLKEALEARHFENWEKLFGSFEEGYESIGKEEAKKVFERLKAIEKRGRYKY